MKLIKFCVLFFACACILWAQENDDSLQITKFPGDTAGSVGDSLRLYNSWTAGGASLLFPGAGQVYTHHYVKAGFFVALDAILGSMAYFWGQDVSVQEENAAQYRTMAEQDRLHGFAADSADDFEHSLFLHNNALESRYSEYNFLTWMIGAHVYNVLDAVQNSNRFKDEKPRKPLTAGLLAAVPVLGLGQFYNGSYSKQGLMIMGQLGLGMMAYNANRSMINAEDNYIRLETPLADRPADSLRKISASKYSGQWRSTRFQAFTSRNMFLWYSIFFYGFSIFDAVVDAYLHDYPEKMRIKPDLAIGKQGCRISLSARF